ncbi:MAG: hypothetical protein M3P04_09710 [Actinomycetota bacterium]|nr:hypothetical protein [Actinomycetota bacterium]
MKVSRLLTRTAALVVPAALLLGATGTAFAAKPPRTPAPVITSKPNAFTNSTTAAFAWTVVAGTAYTCSLDGGGYTTCVSPKNYSGLTNRVHTFGLKAKAVGKPASTSYSWTVDTVAPVAPVVTPIPGPTSNQNASVSFSDSDASVTGFTCALDGGAAVACTSPHSYTGLSFASHTVVVTASDAAGNSSSGSTTWVVSAGAPNIPSVTGPTSPTNNPDASVSFVGDPLATGFTCALDAELALACTSPWTRTGLADGSHTLTVTPFNGPTAGPAGSATWVVDTLPPPAPVLVSAPASTTSDPAFTVRFATTDLSTSGFQCTWQLVTSACGTTWTVPALPAPTTNTTYSLQVRAHDLAGNLSTSALDVSWFFDSTAPSPAAFLSGPATPSNVTDPAFDFTDTDTTTTAFQCSLDGGAFATCVPGTLASIVAPATVSLTEGDHTLSVRALDDASPTPNASAAVDWHWVVDLTAPTSQPHAAPGVLENSGPVTSTPTFVFTTDDPNAAGFVCKLDGATTWTPCASGYTPSVGDGPHTLQVATVDQAGNVGTPVSFSWTLDTVAPLGVLSFPTTLSGPAKVSFAEAVQGITSSSVKLLLAGTTTPVVTSQTCLNAASSAVSCVGAGVRSVVLGHSARLVPGQRYVFSVSAAVHDLAGNPASAPGTVFRALRVLQENELAVVQGWAPKSSTAAYGGKYLQGRLAGAQATYGFRGTSITWYTATGPAMGTAKVFCGTTLKATVNNYSATTKWRVPRTVKCSSTTANNSLRVMATGLKGSSLGKGTQVVFDAVKVGAVLTTNPVVPSRWATVTTSLASAGRYGVADQANESFAMSFRGTSITWRTVLGKNMGKAKVYIDGVYKGTFDQFASTTRAYNRTWALTDKVHTIKVIVTGTRRTGATGTRVALDALTVG